MGSFLSLTVAIALCAFASPSYAATAEDAGKYVDSLGNKALAIISNTALGKDKREKQLENLFSSNVDVPWVGRFVMGRSWKDATDDQKKRYLHEYESFLVQHYAVRFTQYTSGSFKVVGTKDDGDDEFVVSMQIQASEKDEPVMVDYRVRANGSSFKVFDIIVEGVSMITTQRSEFSSVISSHDVEYLIEQLKNHSIPIDPGTMKK